jgi:hypothetical protein
MSISTASDMDWRHLSTVPEKRRRYEREPYFREALDDAERVLGPQLFRTLHAVALAIVRPDALVARRGEALMRFFADNAFTPVEVRRFTFTRHAVRALWRYQWNAATLEKMELADRINCAAETAWLLLRDDAAPRELPAAVRLKTLKGHAVPAQRTSGSLRAALGAPNRMLTFVHTADEPADVLRELGILLEPEARRHLLSRLPDALEEDATQRCTLELRALQAAVPHAEIDPEAAWERVIASADDIARGTLLAQRALLQRGQPGDIRLLLRLCRHMGARAWDDIVICAEAVEHDDPGYAPVLAFDGRAVARWNDRGTATLCSA